MKGLSYRAGVGWLGLALLALSLAALVRQAQQPDVVTLTPTLTGRPELCLTCHEGIEEISPSHPTEAFGCVLCHGGDALALDADLAHATLRGGRNPSDLSVVQESCGGGDCHSGAAADGRDHIHRVLTSVQATYAGAIAEVNYVFGQQPDLAARYGIFDVVDDVVQGEQMASSLQGFEPGPEAPEAVHAFADNCLSCHLSAPAQEEFYYYRSTGCAACHVVYENDGLYQGDDPTIDRQEAGHGREHRLTTAIPYSQCNHCHNQGNYSLAQMDFLEREDRPGSPHLNREERRLLEYYQPIAQFTRCEWELDCVDCHTNGEVMGDGDLHPNQKSIQYVQCQTCHGTLEAPPQRVTIDDPEHPALRSAGLNPNYTLAVGDTVVGTERGETMGWVRWEGESLVLTGKVSGQTYEVPLVQGSACEQDVEEQESRYCHECHAYER